MKRFLSAFVAILLLLVCVPMGAFADNGLVLTIDDVADAKVGSEFSVSLRISGDYELHILNLNILFSTAALELVSATEGEFLEQGVRSKSGIAMLDSQSAPGSIKLGIVMPIDAMSGDGVLIAMRFKVKEGTSVNQQIVIKVTESSLLPIGEFNSTPVGFTTNNCIISISGASDPNDGFIEGEVGTGEHDPSTITTPDPNSSTEDTDDPNTHDPAKTSAPNEDATPIPGDEESPADEGLFDKPLVWVAIGVVVVAICALAAILVVRKRNAQ